MEKTRDQMEGQKKDFRLLLGLIPIALIVWLTLGTIDTQMRVSLTSELQTVLDTTRGGLRIWAAARKAHITAWAESNNVSQAVALQLQLPRTAETLRRGPALKALRMLLNPAVQQDHSPLGFAVVAPDGLQVAAAVDGLVGGREVQRYDPTSITRAFTGATTLGVPFLTTTEVDLGNGVISPTESPAMIVASPIRDSQGTVIAVLTFFLDPTMMDRDRATAIIRTWEVGGQRARTPIVALTANAFREEVEKSLLAGCDAHLTKPIKKQTLLTALVQMKTLTVRTQAA